MPKAAYRISRKTDHTRDVTFSPRSLNESERTVEVVAATETPVSRWGMSEVILCTPEAIDDTRLKGLPFIDSHDRSSVLAVLGQVIAHKIERRQLIATIKFADSERGRQAFDLVKGGMLNKVSVGYTIREYEETKADDGATIMTVTDWMPFELSLVSVPADHNATIRGVPDMPVKKSVLVDDDQLQNDDNNQHQNDDNARIGHAVRTTPFARQLDELRQRAIDAGLSAAQIDAEFEGLRTVSAARERVFDMLADRANSTQTRSVNTDGHNASQAEANRQIVDAIAVRLGAAPSAEANPLRGHSLIQIGRQFMEGRGVSTRSLDDVAIADALVGRPGAFVGSRSHSVSDFPLFLQSAGNRVLLERYVPLASPLKRLSSKRNANNFRRQTFIRPGEAPKLQKVGENGEIKRGTLSEDSRGLQLDTYAQIFALSRQAIINDDLGAFGDFISAFAQSASETEGDLFFALLSANSFGGAVLSDGKTLFHADHGNLAASGGAIGEATVSAGRQAMRLQKNVNGTGTAGDVPAVLLVGPKNETAAEKFVASINAATSADANPFAGKLRVEVENQYEGNGWWLFADPQRRPAFMHGYLTGSEGPIIDTKDGWDVLGTEFRCLLDFGCGVLDYRAAYFNPGQ